MAIGAPPTLLTGSQQAGLDEIKHAKMCYGIAEAFLGTNILPSSLDIDGSVKAQSGEEIIQSVVNEGCIGETIAAVKAQLGAQNAKEPMVKKVLETIAYDESNHAQLAWNTIQWAIDRFPSLKDIAKEAFEARLHRSMIKMKNISVDYCYDCDRDSFLRDHGLLLNSDQHSTENLGIKNVIEPVVQDNFKNVETISTTIMNMDFSIFR